MTKRAKHEPGATMQRLTILLPIDLIRAARHVAVDADLNLQDVVAAALRAYVARKGTAK